MTGSRASSRKPRQTVPNETKERRGELRFLSQSFTCANTSLTVGVVNQVIDNLKAILARIVIHTTEHYITEELLKSQDGGSGATERFFADRIFH